MSQYGFRPKRENADVIFVAHQLQEKCEEQHQDFFTVFINLNKVFDTVNGDGPWQLLKKFGCPEKFTKIVCLLHEGMLGRVSLDGHSLIHSP